MKTFVPLLTIVTVSLLSLVSCSDPVELINYDYVPCTVFSGMNLDKDSPVWQRHNRTSIKILAIGNSFTSNATTHLPGLLNILNDDYICIMSLVRGGCSHDMHWKGHIDISSDYNSYYSDKGEWKLSGIKNIDRALVLFDWDIIVLQQVSSLSGIYSSYQPALDDLVRLFRETNPQALLALAFTWAYTPGTKNDAFKDYDRNAEKMYNAIIDACDKASKDFDIRIPSATLIKRMREEFKEVKNGFTDDGLHITYDPAMYALGLLWYEKLVAPLAGTSSLGATPLPDSVNAEDMSRVNKILMTL